MPETANPHMSSSPARAQPPSPATGPVAEAAQSNLWRLVETYHAIVYYAPERKELYAHLGLKGGWMGYFATRAAPLGAVGPKVVTACFYGFAESMVARALPDAWDLTTPAAAVAARDATFDAAFKRLTSEKEPPPAMAEAAAILKTVVEELSPHGRPMFAAHADTPCPHEPHLALFWAATALREYRGDAHIVALQAAEVPPAASHVLMTAMGLALPEQRLVRGWTEAEWADATSALIRRDWLTEEGRVTRKGIAERAVIERTTDRLTANAWARLSADDHVRVLDVLSSLCGIFVAGGEVPFPNAAGVAPAGDPAATE